MRRIQQNFSPLVVWSEDAMIRIGNSQIRNTPPAQSKAKPKVTTGSRAIATATISNIANRFDRVFISISFVLRQRF